MKTISPYHPHYRTKDHIPSVTVGTHSNSDPGLEEEIDHRLHKGRK